MSNIQIQVFVDGHSLTYVWLSFYDFSLFVVLSPLSNKVVDSIIQCFSICFFMVLCGPYFF